MIQSGILQKIKAFGGAGAKLAYARWAPSAAATQTLSEAKGITSIARTAAGAYTINMARPCGSMLVLFSHIDSSVLRYQFASVVATSPSGKTVTVTFKDVAAGLVASGPTSTDTVPELQVMVLQFPSASPGGTNERRQLEVLSPDVVISYVKWNPTVGFPQTLTEAQGVKSVTRPSTGLWTVTLARKSVTTAGMLAFAQYAEDDTTNYHWLHVTSTTPTTVGLAHRTSPYANVTAPAPSDVLDTIELLVIQRVAS